MFNVNLENMAIEMHRGDTGSFTVTAEKASGDAWTAYDRMIFTVKSSTQEIVLQRYYRLDSGRTSVDLDPGVALIEFHNEDTDDWGVGTYNTELRFVGNAIWEGTPVTDDLVDVLLIDSRIVDGVPVRTEVQSSLTINGIYGEV